MEHKKTLSLGAAAVSDQINALLVCQMNWVITLCSCHYHKHSLELLWLFLLCLFKLLADVKT